MTITRIDIDLSRSEEQLREKTPFTPMGRVMKSFGTPVYVFGKDVKGVFGWITQYINHLNRDGIFCILGIDEKETPLSSVDRMLIHSLPFLFNVIKDEEEMGKFLETLRGL